MASVTSALWPLHCRPPFGVASAGDASREQPVPREQGFFVWVCLMGGPGGFLGEGLSLHQLALGRNSLCKG